MHPGWNVWMGTPPSGTAQFKVLYGERIPPVDWDLGDGVIYELCATIYTSKEDAQRFARSLRRQAKR